MTTQSAVAAQRAARAPMSVFERYLTLWVFVCIVVGVLVGQVFPAAFQAIGRMELARGENYSFGHAPVQHHAKHLEIFAAVGASLAAWEALAAVHVRFHRTTVAGLHVRHGRADGEHLDAQLVSGNPRIAEERHLA